MEKPKKIDKRESVRVVTANGVIDTLNISKLSLNARKLLYIIIAQCKKGDTEFYTYETTPAELADMWGVAKTNIYATADAITDELMPIVLSIRDKNSFKKRTLFSVCEYDNARLRLKINAEMADMLLGVNRDFSKPQLWDFMRMRSKYSMAIWHVMQREMKSFKPGMTAPIVFELSLDELRKATGTENKLKQVVDFKNKVLDKALEDIERNCLVSITYTNIKRGRTVVGFEFIAESYFGTVDIEKLTLRERQHLRRADLLIKKNNGTITKREAQELQFLKYEMAQMNLEDMEKDYTE